ncbi:MAG: hypothetical protein ORN54_10110 [Cyclobacteriaceae bacterium]|nr:hypothetical protein [Cyclobacteriaceae bacterium]
MKNFIKPILIASGILLFTSCGESPSVKKSVDLQPEEKQTVLAMSGEFNTLLQQKATIDFVKSFMQQSDKASFMFNYLSANFNTNQKQVATTIIEHLFEQNNASLRLKESDFFTLSPAVAEMSKKLSDGLKNKMIETKDLPTDQMSSALKLVISDFKTAVENNSTLTFDEARGLIAFAEFESNSIADIVNMSSGLNSSIGGRSQGWFSNLIQAVVTAVVAAVVVVAVVATAGTAAIGLGVVAAGSWFGTAVAVGAIVGGAYGGIVGYDNASRGRYFTDFNAENVGGGFLDWENCSSNPGAWACI